MNNIYSGVRCFLGMERYLNVWHGVAPFFGCGTVWHQKQLFCMVPQIKKVIIYIWFSILTKNVARWHGGTEKRPFPLQFCEN